MLRRYTLTPKSPHVTPFMSDTFFGHFCWAMRYKHGTEKLDAYLEQYADGNPAPVLFSSAFPAGFLPRPTLPSPSRKKLHKFVAETFGNEQKSLVEGLTKIKKWSKITFISKEHWLKLKNNYSDIGFYNLLISNDGLLKLDTTMEIAAANTINRLTNTVPGEGGGGLFHREKQWYKDTKFDLYVEINDDSYFGMVDDFLRDFLPKTGFGADKTVGMGFVELDLDETFNPSEFDVQDANARMSLSLASFPGMENIDAFYKLKTKFGKLGGEYAFSSPDGGNPNPFKKPILMYEPGAIFFRNEPLNNKALLSDVHVDKSIRHCGVPVTIQIKLAEDDR